MAEGPHRTTRPAPAAASRVGGEETQDMRKCVRSQGCPEKVGHPSLPDHPHRYPTWLSWRGRQKKRGVGRAEKSPESENKSPSGRKHRAQVPQSPAHLHRRLHTCGWPGEAAKPHLCAWSIGGHLAHGKTPADSFQQPVLG
ncbi:hypothetical protein mRhiFer1_008011 [Rhinolophus ferrumequinum]|uniref:Uncharacterized protein n=1 Tax=Rhinolophus ferrumequinum TaxID=59479 RepID=A0A7J7WQW0_RHIFE|nr:hypothetical protein mRhiFer1_008011 [Rhinolophus ferrumequinum]